MLEIESLKDEKSKLQQENRDLKVKLDKPHPKFESADEIKKDTTSPCATSPPEFRDGLIISTSETHLCTDDVTTVLTNQRDRFFKRSVEFETVDSNPNS